MFVQTASGSPVTLIPAMIATALVILRSQVLNGRFLLKIEHTKFGSISFVYNSRNLVTRITTEDNHRLDIFYNAENRPFLMVLDRKAIVKSSFARDGRVQKAIVQGGYSPDAVMGIATLMQRVPRFLEPMILAGRL